MKNLTSLYFVIILFLVLSCEKKEEIPVDIPDTYVKENINGLVQKGPFINGTSITVSELTSELGQTGKVFITEISDNKGSFELNQVELSSQFVTLRANGFYFNEILNETSEAQLTLNALTNLSDKSNVNINILSSLEKKRVEYLIANGSDFQQAKSQAQSEILKIFEIDKSDVPESEELNISADGEDNAILLAVSLILQGYNTTSELSELLANISSDIEEDGTISAQLGTNLINNAKAIKLGEIRNNLESRYEALGENVTIPDFEFYVNNFIENTDFEFTNIIEYPENGAYGPNILFKDSTEYLNGDYSLCAILPEGSSLKVKIAGEDWGYPVSQDFSGWETSSWNSVESSRFFTAKKTGEINLKIMFFVPFKTTIIKIYIYENGDTEPTWTKEITVDSQIEDDGWD